jgi:t-SNARE complex subunit (syntaxin)
MNYEQGGRVGYRFGSRLKTKDPKIKMQVSNKHQQLLNLLKQRQSKQLMKGLKNVIANKRKIQDKSPEQIKKAMDRLAQLKKFYGRA